MEVPELAFRITCAVLPDPVGLIYWLFDDHRTCLHASS
jgi:hypothetical protein